MSLGQEEPFDPKNPDHLDPTKYKITGYESNGRHPTSVNFNVSLKTDASRRDLTINSMYIDQHGNIIDYFNGKRSILNKTIKTVGNPNDRFEEDKLRLLRVVRFSAKLGFEIEPDTKNAIIKHKEGLKDISVERIKDELVKMASQSGTRFVKAITTLDEVGILDIILPEVVKLKDFKETPEHHPEAYEGDGSGTVFDHTMAALRRNKVADPIINLGILFHDIGKQATYKNIDGKYTYHGHASDGKEIIDVIAKRLKMTNKEKNSIVFAMVNHMKLFKGSTMKPAKIVKIVNDENWEVLKAISYCDDSCRTGLFNRKTFNQTIDNMEKIAKKYKSKMAGNVLKVVDGKRVLDLTGLTPSKKVGLIISKVTDIILSKGLKDQNEIDKYIMKVYKELS